MMSFSIPVDAVLNSADAAEALLTLMVPVAVRLEA
ncbi:hypothetical protein Rifp1Sym_eh00050 [endosymbiont of Riftia pachyptila (vent Ph05)]|uniref:Uncharacterized protein n=1 Tax=endosymbiont of Riftia pachyptila (vent Ph05) TaxID=1048808 RepID=G2DH42_9GAMM|nr:hypothetical protein Rifp1Sym_eh00050 [endosymbiont of Riftia pachyptila (vent Ph05)]